MKPVRSAVAGVVLLAVTSAAWGEFERAKAIDGIERAFERAHENRVARYAADGVARQGEAIRNGMIIGGALVGGGLAAGIIIRGRRDRRQGGGEP